ncbi:MAG TPA: hypothetical protein VLA72_23105 [Anaerolineales bacterium]|nr:hypothetical protein [Anaerolineales bacterium]
MKLVWQAYQYIEIGDFKSAGKILEIMVDDDPLDVEAWEAYLQISDTCEELDNLYKRVLQIPDINPVDRKSLLDYYYFLRRKKESFDLCGEKHEKIILKVVDQITFGEKDGYSLSNDVDTNESFKRRLVLILNGAIFVSYAVLTIISFSLLSNNNYFGYWMMAVLLTTAILGSRNVF